MTLLYRLKSQTTDEVDYSGDVTDWMYEPESKDTVANLLVSIGTAARGSAGGSLHQANAAVCLMKLATIDSRKAEYAVKTYLNGMNAMQDIDTWLFFKWIIKTFIAVTILSNTFNIVMAVFDVAQSVVAQSAGLVQGTTDISPNLVANMQATIEQMELGPLLGLWLQSFVVHHTMTALNIFIFVVVYGRMIEIYMLTSLAPLPFATVVNRDLGHMGHNYFRSLLAIGFQGLLIIVCLAIYAVLIQSIAAAGGTDIFETIWTAIGCTVLLCFTLLKTGSLAKAVFGAH